MKEWKETASWWAKKITATVSGGLSAIVFFVWRKSVLIWSVIIVLTGFSGWLFYPPTTVSLPDWKTETLAKPIDLLSFAADILHIPAAIQDYEVYISYMPPKDCFGTAHPNSFAEITMDDGNALIPYFEQAFATTSCSNIMNVWGRTGGIPQRENGTYTFCLPEGSTVHFTYPADKTIYISPFIPQWWNNVSCSAWHSGVLENGYVYRYARPNIGEVVVGWLGLLLLWIVTAGSIITILEWSRPDQRG